MISLFITLIRFSYLSNSEDTNSNLRIHTLKFCTDFNIKDVKSVSIDKNRRYKIVKCTKIFTDGLSRNEDSKIPPLLPNSNSYVYTLEFNITEDKENILVMRNEFEDPIMFVKISFCSNSLSGLKFEFAKSISDFDQSAIKPVNLIYKEFKTLHLSDVNIYILGESNLSFVKSLLDFEFYLITQELKNDVLNPMTHFYKDIKKSFKGTDKLYLISKKFYTFFEKMKDAFVMKYNLQVSENLEWTYLNSDNISLDENKIFNSMQILVRDTFDKMCCAIDAINMEVMKLEGSEYITDVFNDLIFFFNLL
jgi:hypothetical protein